MHTFILTWKHIHYEITTTENINFSAFCSPFIQREKVLRLFFFSFFFFFFFVFPSLSVYSCLLISVKFFFLFFFFKVCYAVFLSCLRFFFFFCFVLFWFFFVFFFLLLFLFAFRVFSYVFPLFPSIAVHLIPFCLFRGNRKLHAVYQNRKLTVKCQICIANIRTTWWWPIKQTNYLKEYCILSLKSTQWPSKLCRLIIKSPRIFSAFGGAVLFTFSL